MDGKILVAAAVIRREGRLLLGRRPEGKRHGGLWEFPGGKLLTGETMREAIERELREELDLDLLEAGDTLFRTGDPGSPFEISFVEVEASGTPQAREHSELGWFEPRALGGMDLAPADRRFVVAYLGGGEEALTGSGRLTSLPPADDHGVELEGDRPARGDDVSPAGEGSNPLKNVIALGGVLFGLWVLLSGHFEPLLLFLGVLSTALTVYIATRMDVVDHEGVPVAHLSRRIWTYLPWLVWEVWRSNVAVARIVLHPTLRISPTLVRFRAAQRTDLGRVIMANSVTMTPGTITVAVTGEELHVHALYRDAVDGLEDGEMNRRVAGLERSP